MVGMSTFKCGLRRFDGHGTSSYRPTNTAATKEMESAFSRMMREREQQDCSLTARPLEKSLSLPMAMINKGCFTATCDIKEESVQEEKVVKKEEVKQESEEPKGNCYSLSDATPTKKTA